MPWNLLAEAYRGTGVVPVLGAGASLDSALPNWHTLIERVAAACAATGTAVPFGALCSDGYSLQVIASVAEERCFSSGDSRRRRQQFIELVREELYRDFPFYPSGVTRQNSGEFTQFISEGNPTLRAVAALCNEPVDSSGTSFRPNPRVRAIVTFNLDSLLQAFVRKRYGKGILRTIDRSSADNYPNSINVYHVHGFLRFDGKAGDPKKEASDQAVLTEQDYFDFFNDPSSLFNYATLYLLREYSCLFIGLGLRDENLRRLLHISKMERVRSLEAEGVPPDEIRNRTMRHFAMLERTENRELNQAVEDSLAPLGTHVLWLNGYKEIPDRLGTLYESACKKWSAVY